MTDLGLKKNVEIESKASESKAKGTAGYRTAFEAWSSSTGSQVVGALQPRLLFDGASCALPPGLHKRIEMAILSRSGQAKKNRVLFRVTA